MELAEKKPEFRWGPGRHPGSKNKQLAPAHSLTPEGRRKRQQRQPKKLIDLIRWDKN